METRPVGRPSKYDPSYCQIAIEQGRLGKSIESIGCTIGVGTKTLYNWRDQYPEFLHALELAQQYELEWWETIAQTHMVENKESDRLNASIWSRSMAARFPKKYRESVKQGITGADGAPFVTNIAVNFVKPDES